MRRRLVLMLALATGGSAAAETRTVGSRLFVERALPGGLVGTRLMPAPDRLPRGQSVVVLVSDGARAGAEPVAVVSAVPAGLRFDRFEGHAELSIDGGRHFRPLLVTFAGERRGQPAEVTHLRWRIAPGARPPVLSFRGTVR